MMIKSMWLLETFMSSYNFRIICVVKIKKGRKKTSDWLKTWVNSVATNINKVASWRFWKFPCKVVDAKLSAALVNGNCHSVRRFHLLPIQKLCGLSLSYIYVYILKLFSFLPLLKGQHSLLIQWVFTDLVTYFVLCVDKWIKIQGPW